MPTNFECVCASQKYVTTYMFSNAEMSQLWATFEEVAEHRYKIGEIMDTWTRQMGFPVVTVQHVAGDRYVLNQSRFLVNPDDKFDLFSSPYGWVGAGRTVADGWLGTDEWMGR